MRGMYLFHQLFILPISRNVALLCKLFLILSGGLQVRKRFELVFEGRAPLALYGRTCEFHSLVVAGRRGIVTNFMKLILGTYLNHTHFG